MKKILAAAVVCSVFCLMGASADAGRIYHNHYTRNHHYYHGHYPRGYTYRAPRQYVIPPRYYGPTPYYRGAYGRGFGTPYGYYGRGGFSVQTPGFGLYIR